MAWVWRLAMVVALLGPASEVSAAVPRPVAKERAEGASPVGAFDGVRWSTLGVAAGLAYGHGLHGSALGVWLRSDLSVLVGEGPLQFGPIFAFDVGMGGQSGRVVETCITGPVWWLVRISLGGQASYLVTPRLEVGAKTYFIGGYDCLRDTMGSDDHWVGAGFLRWNRFVVEGGVDLALLDGLPVIGTQTNNSYLMASLTVLHPELLPSARPGGAGGLNVFWQAKIEHFEAWDYRKTAASKTATRFTNLDSTAATLSLGMGF